MGGSACKAAGVDLEVNAFTHGATMGFIDVLRSLRSIRFSFNRMVCLLREWRPHLLILVDYPDFNLRLAHRAKGLGIRVLYYVPPKVWAWRAGRVEKIKNCVDRIAAIFPFEPAFYRERGFDQVTYVGNPVSDEISADGNTPQSEAAARGEHVVILAGSRKGEVRHILLPVLRCFQKLCARYSSLTGTVVVAPNMDIDSLRQMGELCLDRSVAGRLTWSQEAAISVMRRSRVGILKSGTCNLEAALVGLPFLCVYSGSRFSNLIVRNFVKLKEFSPVNIIRPGTVREVAEVKLDEELLCNLADGILADTQERRRICSGLTEVRDILASADPSLIAFRSVAARVAHLARHMLEQLQEESLITTPVSERMAGASHE
jgi:lipid-A-disaccharide synthase